jgi:hypothetical protein
MRSPAIPLATVALAIVAASPRLSAASETTSKTIDVRAQVAARTSLTVSTDLLRFDVTDPASPAVVTVNFVAGVRTQSGAEVILTIETVPGVNAPRGSADPVVRFSAAADGAFDTAVSAAYPVVVRRWTGSGRRTGTIAFALRAPQTGVYTVPVRFILTAP